MPKQNNVTRLLEKCKISHTVYELPPEKISAVEVARLLDLPLDLVYKTIVVTRQKPGKPILAVVPGNSEVDLKALAKAVSEKKLYLPTEKEAEQLTGLLAGGISPLALLNRRFQVILDDSAASHNEIHISGGERGLNIRLPVEALVDLTHAQLNAITKVDTKS